RLGIELGLLGAEVDLQIERLLERARVLHTLRLELRGRPAELSLVACQQALELVRLGAQHGVLLLGLDALRALLLEPIAEPAAERCTEHETDGSARGGADHGSAADPDRLAFRRALPLGRPPRRRGRRGDRENQQLLAHFSRSLSTCPAARA